MIRRLFFLWCCCSPLLLAAQAGSSPDASSGDSAAHVFFNPRIPSFSTVNLVPNASFEAGTMGWSSVGRHTGWGGDFWGLFGEIDSAEAREGKRSFRIALGPGKTPVTYFDAWPMKREAQHSVLAANRGWIEVEPGQTYTFSVYMRADRNKVPAKLAVFFSPDLSGSGKPFSEGVQVLLGKKWKRYSFSFVPEVRQVFISAGPDLPGEEAEATVWIDAMQLEKNTRAGSFTLRSPVELGLSTTPFGNIFRNDDPVVFKVAVNNGTEHAQDIEVDCEVLDYFDNPVTVEKKNIRVEAKGRWEGHWPLHISHKGYYTVRFRWRAGDHEHAAVFPVAWIDSYRLHDSPFGVNHVPTEDAACRAVQDAGMTWGRNWSVNWGMLEPERGKLSFQQSDEQLWREQKLGFNTLALLPPVPSPDWGSMAPDTVPARVWYRMRYMPQNRDLLNDFIRKSVLHYKDRVKYWEFLNEPVWTEGCLPGKHYNLPGAAYTPADYMELLGPAAAAMKAVDPDCRVIGGFSAEPWRYTSDFLKAGGLEHVDIMNLHNYGGFTPPEGFIDQMDTLLVQMDRYGGRKPIWITECTYNAADSLPWTPWKPSPRFWMSNYLLKDERQCADWTVRYAAIMLARGVEKIFYHQPAEGVINHGVYNLEFAFLGEEGVPRKAYVAQSVLSNMLGARPGYAGRVTGGLPPDSVNTKSVQSYAFQCGEKAVLMTWITEDQVREIRLQIPGNARVYSITGVEQPQEDGGVKLGVSPVYIVSYSMNAAELAKTCYFSGF